MSAPPKKKAVSRTKKPKSVAPEAIEIRGARQNNLKGIDLDIPLGKLTVVTGPSGSGKSSLAFRTIYAEGQRRYVETFSPYTRQFFERMDKPKADSIRGIPPAIAIEQANNIRTTRSTVGTVTELNDYLKLLFPRLATGTDPETGEEVKPETPGTISAWAAENLTGETTIITFGIPVPEGTAPAEFFTFLESQGYLRIYVYGETYRTDSPDKYTKKKLPPIVPVIQDRVKISATGSPARLLEALEAALRLGRGEVTLVNSADGSAKTFSTTWEPLKAPTPGLFSFNSPLGACPECRGFGKTVGIDIDRALPDRSLSIRDGVVKAFQGDTYSECQADLERCCRQNAVSLDTPFCDLHADDQQWVLEGDTGSQDDPESTWQAGGWYGVRGFFKWQEGRAYKMHVRVFLSRYRAYTKCHECGGTRLRTEALQFRIAGLTLPEMWALPIARLLPIVEEIPVPEGDRTTKLVRDEVLSRIQYLERVGLGYLDLDREARSLSGGELQRVNLTTCLGASLTNTLFVLDEPSIGLHPRDTGRLIGIMEGLRDKGNTLVVVEHEEAVMRAADNLVDIGPGRGEHGGELVFSGPAAGLWKLDAGESLTGDYLRGIQSVEPPAKRRKPKKGDSLKVTKATQHNLRAVDVEFPLHLFVCVTGVSGSGKSTLVHSVLYQNILRERGLHTDEEPGACRSVSGVDKIGDILLVDQSPLARTPRSTPAVYVGAFDLIRQLFALTEDAKAQGFGPGVFSFNSGGGRCERCSGTGYEKVEMQFLSDLYVLCPECEGRRYQQDTLEITLDGKSVADVLEFTVTEAAEFFATRGAKKGIAIVSKLQALIDVGLGYLRLGQPMNTLSGGESQRLKLVAHLNEKGSAGNSLLIFDEPTTGLHFDDIKLLVGVFHRLVDAGNSVLVIEHNTDVIRSADHLIDLGPEGGEHGGQLVFTGTPEAILKCKESYTGKFLKPQSTEAIVSEPLAIISGSENIIVAGAREHNLKDITVEIPRDEFVVVTGLSGSGKSTLAFDIVFAEGQRRFLDSMSTYARQFVTQLEKPDVDSISGLPPTVAIEQRVSRGGGKSTVATVTEVWQFLRLLWSKVGIQHCPDSGLPVISQTANSIITTVSKDSKKGALYILAPIIKGRKGYHNEVATWAGKKGYTHLLVDGEFAEVEGFERLERFKEHDIDVVVAELDKTAKAAEIKVAIDEALKLGKGSLRLLDHKKDIHVLSTRMVSPLTGRSFDDLDPRMFSYNSPHGWCHECRGYGVVAKKVRHRTLDTDRHDSVLAAEMDEESKMAKADETELLPCEVCDGARINRDARAVLVEGYRIEDIAGLSVVEAGEAINQLKFTGRDKTIARDIIPEITQRLRFMEEVGLGYLQLDRSAKTLSGGEAQRIRLASQLGSNLCGVLYVLDEPTIGLHPRDNAALLDTLVELRDRGNSVIVVEHDDETMERADTLIDLGPGAGKFGGQVTFAGSLKGPKRKTANKNSPTLQALANPPKHPSRGERRKLPGIRNKEGWIRLKNATVNNLKGIDVAIPLARLTVIAGISGSGKSTLMRGVLGPAVTAALSKGKKPKIEGLGSLSGVENIEAVYEVDQSPIGKTSRSCPATYIKIFDEIRNYSPAPRCPASAATSPAASPSIPKADAAKPAKATEPSN